MISARDVLGDVVDYRAVFERTPVIVGSYQLVRRLRHGRLGDTHEAWHLERQHPAVLKLLAIEGRAEGTRLAAERALLRRLEVLARMSHPRLVPLRDVGLADDGVFIACDMVPGQALDALLRSGWRPSNGQTVAIARALAAALACAHASGLAHGNLHAGQVLLVDGSPYLTDLGLLPAARGLARVDHGARRDPPHAHLAPELAEGDDSPAADTYALGVMVLRMLVGEARFEALARDRLERGGSDPSWPSPAELRPDLPPALSAWLARAIDPDPAHRPELTHAPARHAVVTAPPSPTPLPIKPPSGAGHARRRWIMATALAATAATAAGTLGLADRIARQSVAARDVVDEAVGRAPHAVNAADLSAPAARTPRLRLDR